MDRREAIDILVGVIATNSEEENEALDLAIEALSDMSEEEVDYCNNCPYISWDKDCISRQDAIEALTGWQTEPLDEDIVRTLEALPPVSQKQVTSKLKNPCDSLLTAESDECKEQKSKLDWRQQAIEAIECVDWYHVNSKGELVHGSTSDEESWYRAEDIYKAIESLPPVVPDFKTFCGVPIKEAIEVLEKYKHSPSVKVQQADTLIIVAALRDFAQDSERNISDRERAEELREQVLAYGASMCNPVTPTERTGEWKLTNTYRDHNGRLVDRVEHTECGCIWHREIGGQLYNYCPNCGAKMGGDM